MEEKLLPEALSNISNGLGRLHASLQVPADDGTCTMYPAGIAYSTALISYTEVCSSKQSL